MIYSVNEIFESVMGEGTFAGTFATFVRLSGCNGNCDWCDTDFNENFLFEPDELKKEVEKFNNRHVVLTGGEPTLQLDEILLQQLKNRFVLLETNGSLEIPDEIFDQLDWVTVSPKRNLPLRVKRAHDLKIVWDGNVDPLSYEDKGHWFRKMIQPEWNTWQKHLPNVLKFLKDHPEWFLSIQMHKHLNIK
jgi:7-carboxy-7-deazaguanine synthase